MGEGMSQLWENDPGLSLGSLLVLLIISFLCGMSVARLLRRGKRNPGEEKETEEEEEEWETDSDDEGTVPTPPYKMVLCVRNDLKMGKGKVAAQCSHATLGAYRMQEHQRSQENLRRWGRGGQAKVVLRLDDEKAMDELARKARGARIPVFVYCQIVRRTREFTSTGNRFIVCDAGRTQIAAGSRTVLALGPAPVDKVDAVSGHLKLF